MSENNVHTAFFRELYGQYTFSQIDEKLGLNSESKTTEILKNLKSAGLIKVYKKGEKTFDLERLSEQEVTTSEIYKDSGYFYLFNYVGFAYTNDCIVKCYPKYIEDDFETKELESHFKLVLKALRKYKDTKYNEFSIFDQSDSSAFNKLEIQIYLLQDYFEKGIYTNQKQIIETNGEGEIDWDRTINGTLAIIKNSKPYYVELQTINNQTNENDFFKLLHECIISECSCELGRDGAGILELFDMDEVYLSSSTLEDFGDAEYIKYRLENEIKNQFVTKKQNLLKVLYYYVSNKQVSSADSDFSYFGTNAFNKVWESACSAIFEDVKDTYKPLIEKAKWYFIPETKPRIPELTLQPDTISVIDHDFYILDSKYYFIEHEKDNELSGQPGIPDIIKQFAYHKAFYNYLLDTHFENVSNSFLVPQRTSNWEKEENFSLQGYVDVNLMQDYYMDRLAPIQLVELNPAFVFENYITNRDCTSELKKIKKSKITRNSENSSNRKTTAVGYIKGDYFKQIKETGSVSFIFYYYQQKDSEVFPMHPELPTCTDFIGYTDHEYDEYIKGQIIGTLQIMDSSNLDSKLHNRGFDHSSTAKNYFCFDVVEIEFVKKSQMPELMAKLDLERKQHETLNKYSPMALDYPLQSTKKRNG